MRLLVNYQGFERKIKFYLQNTREEHVETTLFERRKICKTFKRKINFFHNFKKKNSFIIQKQKNLFI